MEIKLSKKPKNVTIVEGFPGFGLVASIATEYLLEHLKMELIGTIKFEDVAPIAAIHNSKLIEPMGIYYNKKFNLLLIHVISNVQGYEWKMTQAIYGLVQQLSAKELISIEGVAGKQSKGSVYYYSTKPKAKTILEKNTILPLKEGIIMGVTAGLLLRKNKIPFTCLFAETASNMPDSKAAAAIIKALDAYLGLKVDYRPLIKTAELFEKNLKNLLAKAKDVKEQAKQKGQLDYFG